MSNKLEWEAREPVSRVFGACRYRPFPEQFSKVGLSKVLPPSHLTLLYNGGLQFTLAGEYGE